MTCFRVDEQVFLSLADFQSPEESLAMDPRHERVFGTRNSKDLLTIKWVFFW